MLEYKQGALDAIIVSSTDVLCDGALPSRTLFTSSLLVRGFVEAYKSGALHWFLMLGTFFDQS